MTRKIVKGIESRVKPNTFAVITIKQGIENDKGAFIAGSYEVYDKVFKGVLRAVERRLWGKRAIRRKPRRISNITTLEGKFSNQFHIHSCLHRPPHVSLAEFTRIFAECWQRSKWYRPNFQIEEYRGGGVAYILKEGQDAILLGSSQF